MSDDYKPGDLAVWVTPAHSTYVLLTLGRDRVWRTPSGATVDTAEPNDLLHVLGPDEKPAPKGSVVLDPGSDEHARDLMRALHFEVGITSTTETGRRILLAVAAEQNAPDPATVWTDGDVVQQVNRCDSFPMYAAQRLDGEWWSMVAGEAGPWMQDVELNTWVERGELRVLRQASTGIGCEADQ